MKSGKLYQRNTLLKLLMGLATILLLLAACSRDPTTNADAANSTPTQAPQAQAAANSATETPAQAAPTPTAAQTKPVDGSPQSIMIVDSNDSFGFAPATLTIKAGTTITWKNTSSAPHTVTSDDRKAFASDTIDTGGTFSFTFKNAGTFPYHCTIHPFMKATIIVV